MVGPVNAPPPRLPASTDISIMAAKAGDVAHNRLELLAIKVSGCFSKADKKLLPFPAGSSFFLGGGDKNQLLCLPGGRGDA